VIQLLHGHQAKVAMSVGSWPAGRARAGLPHDVYARIGALDHRLAALAKELDRLNAEQERLRAILREHGIEPGADGTDGAEDA